MSFQKSLVWFRRDLRDYDHAALYHALKSSQQVFCAFVFDTDILDLLKDKEDRRVEFIWESINELKRALQNKGGDIIVLHGKAVTVIPALAHKLGIEAVFANHDYEPNANFRDAQVTAELQKHHIEFHHFKDQVIFEKDEILNLSGKPYGVFTPFKNMWLKTINDYYLLPYSVDKYAKNLAKTILHELPSLESMGFKRTNLAKLH
nr:deoxyribodipyrimidine photo-lyase [Methylotenera sp.]